MSANTNHPLTLEEIVEALSDVQGTMARALDLIAALAEPEIEDWASMAVGTELTRLQQAMVTLDEVITALEARDAKPGGTDGRPPNARQGGPTA